MTELRGISIHIGVNKSETGHPVLAESETHAWQMAELAHQGGFRSIHVLQGPEATCAAVEDRIAAAASGLSAGDVLLVSYSGHGSQVPDVDGDEGESDKQDETWCLADGNLLDDRLAECWRQAPTGARIVVVSESCYGAGAMRGDVKVWGEPGTTAPPAGEDSYGNTPIVYRGGPAPGYRGGPDGFRGVEPAYTKSSVPVCITHPPENDDGIRASVLVLAAAEENRPAQAGLYIPQLLRVWNGGRFHGSYCDLHRRVTGHVRDEAPDRGPVIAMLGSRDVDFPNQAAFRMNPPVMRGVSY